MDADKGDALRLCPCHLALLSRSASLSSVVFFFVGLWPRQLHLVVINLCSSAFLALSLRVCQKSPKNTDIVNLQDRKGIKSTGQPINRRISDWPISGFIIVVFILDFFPFFVFLFFSSAQFWGVFALVLSSSNPTRWVRVADGRRGKRWQQMKGRWMAAWLAGACKGARDGGDGLDAGNNSDGITQEVTSGGGGQMLSLHIRYAIGR